MGSLNKLGFGAKWEFWDLVGIWELGRNLGKVITSVGLEMGGTKTGSFFRWMGIFGKAYLSPGNFSGGFGSSK